MSVKEAGSDPYIVLVVWIFELRFPRPVDITRGPCVVYRAQESHQQS